MIATAVLKGIPDAATELVVSTTVGNEVAPCFETGGQGYCYGMRGAGRSESPRRPGACGAMGPERIRFSTLGAVKNLSIFFLLPAQLADRVKVSG